MWLLKNAGIVEASPEDDTVVRWNPAFVSPANALFRR